MKEVKEVATGSASFSGEDTVNPVSVRGNVSFHSTANALSETSISSSSDAGRNPLDMKSNLPTACSEKMEKRGFWKSPFQSNQQEIPEFPHVPVVHVVGESPGDLGPCMMKFKNGLYLPLNKHMLFFPHFLQDFLHKTVRFYLKPVEDEATSHNKGECKRLNESLRYLDATFEYCKEKTSHVSVRLWENHGKSRRQHRNRPLFSSIVYVDTETKSVVIKGGLVYLVWAKLY